MFQVFVKCGFVQIKKCQTVRGVVVVPNIERTCSILMFFSLSILFILSNTLSGHLKTKKSNFYLVVRLCTWTCGNQTSNQTAFERRDSYRTHHHVTHHHVIPTKIEIPHVGSSNLRSSYLGLSNLESSNFELSNLGSSNLGLSNLGSSNLRSSKSDF